MPYGKLKYLPTIRRISDDLWDEIELLLPSEKPNNIIGRHLIPFGKVGWNPACIKNRMPVEVSPFFLGM